MVNLDNFRPADVPGYAAAKAAGLTPAQPTSSPKTLPGLNAKQFLIILAGGGAALFILGVVVTNFLKTVPGAGWMVPVIFIGGFAGIVALAFRVQRRIYEELHQGYTTVQLQFGRANKDRWQQSTVGGGRLSWDYSSVWIMDINGQIVREPLNRNDGPGFYPSPTFEGRFELWTGVSWAGKLAKQASRN